MDTTTEHLADPRRTWRIPDDRRLPALEPYADDVRRLPTVTAREVLWDTSDRALAFAGVELVQPEPPADTSPPRDAVEVVLRGRPISVVRVRETTTALVRLHGDDGRVRAEVADVRVDEGDPGTTLLRSARWWALTDDGQSGPVVRAVERAVSDAADDAGRGPGDPVPARASVRRPASAAGPHPDRGSARAFVRDALVPLRIELVRVDPLVRVDAEDAVHAFRKVLRRLRSVLAAYRGALDPDVTEPLRSALRSTARVAGVTRDAEVLRAAVLRSAVLHAVEQTQPPPDPFALDHLRAQLDDRHQVASAALAEALRAPAWFTALDTLDRVVDQAPAGPLAHREAVAFATKRIVHERRRVRAVLGTTGLDASAAAGDAAALERLHELRKAVRRLRYSLEAAGDLPDVGRPRLGRLARVQDSLGDVLDAHHAADALQQLAAVAARSGVDTFGYGVLAMAELRVAQERLTGARRAVRRLPRAL